MSAARARDYTGWGSCYADNTDPLTSEFLLCQGSVVYVDGVGRCSRCGTINRLTESFRSASGGRPR